MSLFLNDTATTEISPLSLYDAFPIYFGTGPHEIWMYHNDGGTGIQVTKSKPTPAILRQDRPNDLGVVASADGRYLYYAERQGDVSDRKSTRLNSSHGYISDAVFCLKKKKRGTHDATSRRQRRAVTLHRDLHT